MPNNYKTQTKFRLISKATKLIQQTGVYPVQSFQTKPFKEELNIVLKMANGEPFVMIFSQ